MRTWARVLIAISFFVSGLAEMLSASGLVVEVSPDRLWGTGTLTLPFGGPLQMAVAVLLATGRQTRWALGILACYVFLGGVLGNLARTLASDDAACASAIGGLLSSLAILGGTLYGITASPLADSRHQEDPSASRERRQAPGDAIS